MPKNIFIATGLLHGHFTGDVEIIRELISLGHNVTCMVLDEFENRIKDIGAKLIVINFDRANCKLPPDAPPYAINCYIFPTAIDKILTFLSTEKNNYDYFIFDSFFDIKEMNKVLNIPIDKLILICSSFIFIGNNSYLDIAPLRSFQLKPINIKYNINLHDFVTIHYIPNKFKKLILTSKYFHFRGEDTDDTCFFIGPNIEKRKKDENFKFIKDKNKTLIYISLGTIINEQIDFYLKCIEAFKNKEEYQVILSVGKFLDIKKLGEIPKNFSIFSYVPQTQLLPDVDIFITHGGINSIQEGLFAGILLIVIPQANDEFDNGKKVEELGAGISLDKNKINIEALQNAVKNIEVNKEKYKLGIRKIIESFKDSINKRKNIFEKMFK